MASLKVDLPYNLEQQVKRVVKEGWFKSAEEVAIEALQQYVGGKSYLGDSPAMLLSFAADALNESKPEVALKFVDRALSMADSDRMGDLSLYKSLVELKVQVLMVMDDREEAARTLEEAREKLPNNPSITRWLETFRQISAD